MGRCVSYVSRARRLIGVFSVVLLGTMLTAQAQETVLRECIAIVQDVGRSDADMASQLARWPDGRLKLVEIDDPSYTSDDINNLKLKWIELFGAQNGHGSSLLGFFLKENFQCAVLKE